MAVNEPLSFKSIVDTVMQTTLQRQVYRCATRLAVLRLLCFASDLVVLCVASHRRIDEPILRSHLATVIRDFTQKLPPAGRVAPAMPVAAKPAVASESESDSTPPVVERSRFVASRVTRDR